MLNLLKKVKLIISKDKIRREKFLEIISPYLQDWKEYAEIVDIVKEKTPEMYNDFGEGICKYISHTFMGDLDKLCLEGNLLENKHFRKKPEDLCSLAYKLYVPSHANSGIIKT